MQQMVAGAKSKKAFQESVDAILGKLNVCCDALVKAIEGYRQKTTKDIQSKAAIILRPLEQSMGGAEAWLKTCFEAAATALSKARKDKVERTAALIVELQETKKMISDKGSSEVVLISSLEPMRLKGGGPVLPQDVQRIVDGDVAQLFGE